jgi:predicted RNA-binding protein
MLRILGKNTRIFGEMIEEDVLCIEQTRDNIRTIRFFLQNLQLFRKMSRSFRR